MPRIGAFASRLVSWRRVRSHEQPRKKGKGPVGTATQSSAAARVKGSQPMVLYTVLTYTSRQLSEIRRALCPDNPWHAKTTRRFGPIGVKLGPIRAPLGPNGV